METQIGNSTLELVQGDITRQDTDAIVNAANDRLAGGGGVDGAIHRAGGPEIMAACREIGGCPTGTAAITTAGKLPARFVIHAVGPIYRDGQSGEPEKLAGAYRSSLRVAAENELKSVAFPSLSTGAYGYPVRDAAEIALGAVRGFLLAGEHKIKLVRFVLFDDKTLRAYEDALREGEAPAEPSAGR